MTPFLIAGLVTGCVYGLAAVGLVLTYKTSGVFNFAHGALATVAAYVFYALHVSDHLPWPLAAAVAVFVVGPLVALAFEALARSLTGAALAVQVAATVGVMLSVAAALVLIYGAVETRTVPVFLAHGGTTIGSTTVQYSDIVTFAIALTATAGLYLFFRLTRSGAAMRAVVDDPSLLDLAGTSPRRVRRLAWLIGVAFASASGVLLAPVLPLNPTVLTLLVVQAFGAAALGAFTSLPLTFAGGLAIGVLASVSTKWFTTGVLAGVPPAVPFLVLFVVLLVFPRSRLIEGSRIAPRVGPGWVSPPPLRLGLGAALLAFLAVVPAFAGIHLADWTTMLGTAIVLLSLGLLVRTSGQVSLCHVAFAAIGAVALGHLTVDQHVPWLVALALAGLVAVPVGALLAIPAIRLSGLYLALATFGFGVAITYMLYTQGFMFGSDGAGITLPRPSFAGSDTSYYYLVLGAATAATAFALALGRSRLGRLLRALADSPTALTTTGAASSLTRLLVFGLSAFMAAVGGALVGAGQGTVTADSYSPLLSLVYLALVVIAVGREPWSAVLPAMALVLVPSYVSGGATSSWLQLYFGLAAVAYAVVPPAARRPPAWLVRGLDTTFARHRSAVRAASEAPPPERRLEAAVAGGLEVRDLVVRYGGVTAVERASLRAPTGAITALIGPNGAGTTTIFNACSGLVRPESGELLLDGRPITRRSASARARAGLGRTFQRMELF
ncbi:MAG: transporter related, partial [Solirubrobacterales bacterium]|nr:transporter related [Solirubrobacterales bacterium]